MNVQESMSRFVVCLTPEDDLNEAHSLMKALNCRHLPVIRERKLIGMVSDRDILLHGTPNNDSVLGVDLPNLNVTEIMSRNVLTVYRDCQVGFAVDLLIANKIDALPVTGDEGEVIGIVTTTDLLTLLRNQGPQASEKKMPWTFQVGNRQDIVNTAFL